MAREQLTPQQEEDYGTAWVLALEAREAFDIRHNATLDIAKIIADDNYDPESSVAHHAKVGFRTAEKDFEYFQHLAEVVMPPRAAFKPPKTEESTAESTPTVLTWEQQIELSGLSPEEREIATNARDALVVKYKDKHKDKDGNVLEPYTEKDFSLIKTAREVNGRPEDIFTVILSATRAIDLGKPGKYDHERSWNSIVNNKTQKFILFTNGHKLDERSGLTQGVMQKLTDQNPEITECIWETGSPDKADDHDAPLVIARDGSANMGWSGCNSDVVDAAYRPAVVVATPCTSSSTSSSRLEKHAPKYCSD